MPSSTSSSQPHGDSDLTLTDLVSVFSMTHKTHEVQAHRVFSLWHFALCLEHSRHSNVCRLNHTRTAGQGRVKSRGSHMCRELTGQKSVTQGYLEHTELFQSQ